MSNVLEAQNGKVMKLQPNLEQQFQRYQSRWLCRITALRDVEAFW
jgi:hypothetical protein